MKNKHLESEIKTLLNNAEKVLGKDSIQCQNLDYYFDILLTVYEYNFDSEKDLLYELKQLLNKLPEKMPELESQQFEEKYPSISQMIDSLDKCLSE